MNPEFIQRITEGFEGGHYRIELGDQVIIFCKDGLRMEGNLIGSCSEGVLIGGPNANVWMSASAIMAAAKIHGTDGDDRGSEEFIHPNPPEKNGKVMRPVS